MYGACTYLCEQQTSVIKMHLVQVLHEDILPALEKLRREKDQYYQWQTATAKLDVLRRFCIAYKYVEAQK